MKKASQEALQIVGRIRDRAVSRFRESGKYDAGRWSDADHAFAQEIDVLRLQPRPVLDVPPVLMFQPNRPRIDLKDSDIELLERDLVHAHVWERRLMDLSCKRYTMANEAQEHAVKMHQNVNALEEQATAAQAWAEPIERELVARYWSREAGAA